MTHPSDATVEQRAASLRDAGIFATLSAPTRETVAAAMQPARYAVGDFVIRQGEAGRHLHVLVAGEVEVRLHTPGGAVITVAAMAPGACFGEMSLLSGDLTSADVVARTDCQTLMLDRPAFEALVADEPRLLREFVAMVSRRLRESNEAMGLAREKEKGLTRFLQDVPPDEDCELVGTPSATRALHRQIDTHAQGDNPVLIQGERGTGKELVARLIHFRSTRRDAPLLGVDCARIAETPWGDKLFGDYRPGAEGTGPPPVSYLDLAQGGTIVLKGIAALPRAIQDRLAVYLERGSGPVGGDTCRARIIATCREDLDDPATADVSPALARALAGHRLVIPPLRQHKRDIATLAAHFARKQALRLGKPVPTLDDEALAALVTHDYRAGNVSELEEVIRRAVILTDGPRIESEAIFLGPLPPPSRWAFNLLTLPEPMVRRALRLFPRALQVLAALVFGFILYESFFAPAGGENWGTLLVWSVWWPALAVSFFFVGRAWCAICPMMSAGSATQRMVSLGWRIPTWLKRHDLLIAMLGFFAIVWVEEVTAMRRSPLATGLLLAAIMAGAVVTSALFPRRTWCRYLCPLGAFTRLGAMMGVVELRPTPDICAAACGDHSCFRGDEHVDGCPMFNHVMFVHSSQHCVLCLDCVRTCTNHSPQLNLRLPAGDLLTTSDRSAAGRLTLLLGGLLLSLTLLQQWERQAGVGSGSMPPGQRLALMTAVLALGALLPQIALWFVGRQRARSAETAPGAGVWERVTAWVPVVATGFACYELAFVPGLDAVRLTLGTRPIGDAAKSIELGLLPLLQIALSGTGLTIAVVVWRLGRGGGRDLRPWWRHHGLDLAVGAVYWAILTLLIVE